MGDVLLDACCLINLYSSGRPADVLRAIANYWHVCTAVVSETLLFEEMVDGHRKRTAINLEPWIDAGIVRVCSPQNDAELAAYVAYAARIDDGEAMCLALAKCREWTIATDDRKCRRIAGDEGILSINTCEIIRAWSQAASADAAHVRDVINKIETFGRYRPAPGLAGSDWWYGNK